MLKIKKGIAPTLIRQIFFLNKKNSFELRNRTDLQSQLLTLSIMESGPTTREILPLDLEQTGCLSEFKVKITKWNPQNCSCRFCKTLAKYCFYLNLASK